MVENGAYRASSDVVKAPGPFLAAVAYFICVHAARYHPSAASVISYRATIDRPLDWVPTWQFAQRAALPSRAPSLLSA